MSEDTEKVSIADLTSDELYRELEKAIKRWQVLDREWQRRWGRKFNLLKSRRY